VPQRIVGLVLAVLILASLFGGRSLVANVTDGTQHVVKSGETLGAIAALYGVSVEQLVAQNGLQDPDRVTEGQTLRIPAIAAGSVAAAPPPAPASAAASQTAPAAQAVSRGEYVVQPGDTLSGIAKSLGIGLKALLDLNPLADPDRLSVGQKLVVPGSGQPTGAGAGPAPASSSGTQPASTGTANEAGATLDRLAQQYGVDGLLVRALAWIDTNGRPRTLDNIGYLKVTGPTFDYIQGTLVKRTLDRANPADNAEAGIAYVAAMLKWGGEEPKGLAGFMQGPGSVKANGVRPDVDDQVKRVLALRDRLKQGGAPAAPTTANTSAPGAGSTTASTRPTTPPGTGAGAGPTPKPAPSEVTAGLAARVIGAARLVAGADARIGIAGHNLVSGQRLSIAGDQSFPAASVDKLPLLVEAYRQIAGGKMLTDAQQADLRSMVVMSDNDAANRLLELFGARGVNANLQALGLGGTRLVNPFGSVPVNAGAANVTTPADMVRLMDLLASEQLVSVQASREMRALLAQSQDGSKLRRGLPTDAKLAHKSGWYDGVANDVGIVSQGGNSYVIAVFTDGIANAETANQTIAAVAKTVHEAWGAGQ
jgi:LysM repeat protein/beta-lactamase class A